MDNEAKSPHAEVSDHLAAVRMGLPFNPAPIAAVVWPIIRPVLAQIGMAAFRAVLTQLQRFADEFTDPDDTAAAA